MSTSAIGAELEPDIFPVRGENCNAAPHGGYCHRCGLHKCVYGQGWPTIAFKTPVLDPAYFVLVPLAVFFAGFAGLAKL